ncbi:hypothetical protein TEA_027312 [Camellia sinensis var. sinensis]|uniref:RING-type domain-containing protein n=1 Tax=Camellia sinensis var. sinensis TaxID=542762 RepID=A0A4S4CWH6_CAMSN|nr:hypothetical protein TEA_027312 [Camellia sinensis var. sinensis]
MKAVLLATEVSLLPILVKMLHGGASHCNCILQVWNYGSALQPCKCPLCRRQITLLIPSDASSRQRHNSDAAEILGKIERYNRYFGERSNGLIQELIGRSSILAPLVTVAVQFMQFSFDKFLFINMNFVSTVKNSSCTNIRNLDAVMHSELLSYSIYRMQQDVSCCGRTNTWHLAGTLEQFVLVIGMILQIIWSPIDNLRRLFRDIMQPQRSLPLVIRARVYLAVKLMTQLHK